MGDETRKNFLTNLLGKKEADTVTGTLEKAKEALDAAKVTRKEDVVVETAAPPAAAPTPDEIAAAVAQFLVSGGLSEEVANKVAEAVKAALAPAAAEEAPAAEAEMKSLVKSLGDQIGAQTKDSALVAQAVLDLSTVLKDVLPAIKSHDAAIAEIKGIVAGRPRQASKALETETENPELEKRIKEGIEGETKFLGIPVKPLAGVESGNGSKKG